MERRGLLFVVSAPSGAGKTTLCKELISVVPGLRHSISYTTRKPRPAELHGREYFFVADGPFQEMANRTEIAEWSPAYGAYYGTPRSALTEVIDKCVDEPDENDADGVTHSTQ